MLLIHESHVLPVTRGGQGHWPVETEQLSVGLGQLQALGRKGGRGERERERERGREGMREEGGREREVHVGTCREKRREGRKERGGRGREGGYEAKFCVYKYGMYLHIHWV